MTMLLSILPLLLLSASPVAAQAPEADIEPGIADPGSSPQPEPDGTETAETIALYRQIISNYESERGVYDQRLAEELLGLGLALRAAGQQQLAADAFGRSLHVTRINDGLESLAQLPILEQLIAQGKLMEDWESVDQYFAQLYWIHRRNVGTNSIQLLPVLERMGQWQLTANALDPSPSSYLRLLTAYGLYKKAVNIIDATPEATDELLIGALRRIAQINYRIATYAGDIEDLSNVQSGLQAAGLKHDLPPGEVEDLKQINRSYANGKNALVRIVSTYADNPELSRESYALAMTHLGDWYLLFGKRNTASRTYQAAFDILLENGMDRESINRIFSQPVRLPAFHNLALPSPDQAGTEEYRDYVVAEVDLSRAGKARNIRIIESRPVDDDSVRHQAMRSIRRDRFRPRLKDGIPVSAKSVSLKYPSNVWFPRVRWNNERR